MVRVLISADSRYPVSRPNLTERIREFLGRKGITSDVEVSILICGQRKARELSKKYLRQDLAHDVLSFPLAQETKDFAFPTGRSAAGFADVFEGFLILGDIVVCYPLAQMEANSDNLRVDEKIGELVEHGMGHLLGEGHD